MQSTTPKVLLLSVWPLPVSLAATSGISFWFLFLRLLRCFSSAGLPPHSYLIHYAVTEYCSAGFPHSEIHESMDICSSSWLIAACHVLLRLLMPRHSSYALISLTSSKLASLLGLSCKPSPFSAASPLSPKIFDFSGTLIFDLRDKP